MRELIQDENGKTSASRVVLFLFVFCFLAGVFFSVEVNETAAATIQQVILLCLGTVGVRSAIKNAQKKSPGGD